MESVRVHSRAELRVALIRLRRQGKLRRLRPMRKPIYPKRPETEYYLALKKLFGRLRAKVFEQLFPWIVTVFPQTQPRTDSVELNERMDADILTAILNGVRISFAREVEREDLLGPIARRAASKSRKEWKDRVRTVIPIDVEIAEPWLTPLLQKYSRENAQLITRVGERYTDRVAKVVREAVTSGVRAEELEASIRYGLGPQGDGIDLDKRSKIIARDQVSKLSAEIDRERAAAIGVNKYQWASSNDERVRQTHRERNGLIFDYDRDIGEQLAEYGLEEDEIDGHPGVPILCRCRAEPVLTDLIEGLPEI